MKKFVPILMIIMLVLLSITGCGKSIQEKVAEKAVEKMIENSTDEDIDIDIDDDKVTIENKDGEKMVIDGNESEWPDNVPEIIPKWKGDIAGFMSFGDNNFTFTLENVEQEEIDEYVEKLSTAKFKEILKADIEGLQMYSYMLDDKYSVQINYSQEDKEGNILVNIE